ncbi:MAG: OsmC family protein [Chitinophagales bacterium]|nr:OsmC family protein [Chitinophagales bacterium]
MHQTISATIHWKASQQEHFIRGKYSRAHIWEFNNGNQIEASSSPAIVPLPYSNPDFIDPEEAFICSLASCHMLFFLSIASKKKINVLQYEDNPIGTIAKGASNRISITEINLQPKVITQEEIGIDKIQNIHRLAHQNCFIANSIKSKVQIKAL